MRSRACRRALIRLRLSRRNWANRTRKSQSVQRTQRQWTPALKLESKNALLNARNCFARMAGRGDSRSPPLSFLPEFGGDSLRAIATPYHPGHHRFTVILACWTFLLIIAGALVTSNDAGLSVPDWPTSFGSWYKIPKLVGGVKFEHTHRMIAQVAGLLTVVLAVWTWRVEKRRWMRFLGVAAVGTVIAQGVLGGLTVLFFLPPPISSAHAALAQTFFCIAVAMALFTGRKWVEEQPRVEFDQRR